MYPGWKSPNPLNWANRALQRIGARRHVSGAMANLAGAELRHIAADLNVSESDLLVLSSGAADNTALMEALMRARGLDPNAVRRELPIVQRDIERVCTVCGHASRCRSELEAGTAPKHDHDYCLNAYTFDDLVAVSARPGPTGGL